MGVVRAEDIIGYFVGQECVCCDCASKKEEEIVSQNEIITLDDVESDDELYFCDRCQKQIGQM